MLIYICHFHHHHHHPDTFLSNHRLSRYWCLHLGSLHPRIFLFFFCGCACCNFSDKIYFFPFVLQVGFCHTKKQEKKIRKEEILFVVVLSHSLAISFICSLRCRWATEENKQAFYCYSFAADWLLQKTAENKSKKNIFQYFVKMCATYCFYITSKKTISRGGKEALAFLCLWAIMLS